MEAKESLNEKLSAILLKLKDSDDVGQSKLRIHYGPGYRAYFTRRGDVVYFLLLGGDKSTQKRDVKRAKEMARTLPKE